MGNIRLSRVADVIQRELAVLIQREITDPRLGMVTISDVEVSKDLQHAKVFVTVMGEQQDVEESVAVLNKAAKFLRKAMAPKVKLRAVPQLRFYYDSSIYQGSRISALIDEALQKDANKDPETIAKQEQNDE